MEKTTTHLEKCKEIESKFILRTRVFFKKPTVNKLYSFCNENLVADKIFFSADNFGRRNKKTIHALSYKKIWCDKISL